MPDLFQNFASGVLTADPGASGVTLTSGNFAFLPVVAAPNTMRLALDPEGSTGTPELVVVTAHTAAATTCTVTRGVETSYGAGAGRAHAVDTVWRMVQTRQSILGLTTPAQFTTAQRNALAGDDLYRGRTIFNSDTGSLDVYYGAVTGWRPPWNTAWGLMTPVVVGSGDIVGGAGFVETIVSAAFTVPDDRILNVTYHTGIMGDSGAAAGANFSVRRSGSIVQNWPIAVKTDPGVVHHDVFVYTESPPPGSITYGFGWSAGAGALWHDRSYGINQLVITDIGPSGNAPAS